MGGGGSVIGPRVNRYIAVPGLGMVSWYAGIGTDTTDRFGANRALSVGVAPLTIPRKGAGTACTSPSVELYEGSMSKARHSYLENHDTCALRRRIMMSASMRDMREKRSSNCLVAPCTVENRYRGGGDQSSPEDQIAELGEGIEVDRRTAVADQSRVRQDRHAQHIVGQDQQDSSGPRKVAALRIRPTRAGEKVPRQTEQHQCRPRETEQCPERVRDEVAVREQRRQDQHSAERQRALRCQASAKQQDRNGNHHDGGSHQIERIRIDRGRRPIAEEQLARQRNQHDADAR